MLHYPETGLGKGKDSFKVNGSKFFPIRVDSLFVKDLVIIVVPLCKIGGKTWWCTISA